MIAYLIGDIVQIFAKLDLLNGAQNKIIWIGNKKLHKLVRSVFNLNFVKDS